MISIPKRVALLAAAFSLPALVACGGDSGGEWTAANMNFEELMTIGRDSIPEPTFTEVEIGTGTYYEWQGQTYEYTEYGIRLSQLNSDTCPGGYEWRASNMRGHGFWPADEAGGGYGSRSSACASATVYCGIGDDLASALVLASTGYADPSGELMLGLLSGHSKYTYVCDE